MSKDHRIDVAKILSSFGEEEHCSTRKGAFKIDTSFERAVKKILKAKPEPKKRKAKDDKRS